MIVVKRDLNSLDPYIDALEGIGPELTHIYVGGGEKLNRVFFDIHEDKISFRNPALHFDRAIESLWRYHDLYIFFMNGEVLIEKYKLFFDRSFYIIYHDFNRYAHPLRGMRHYPATANVAAITHVYNDVIFLRRWCEHYSKICGMSNIYIIDHGSTLDVSEHVPDEVNIVRIPRGPVDHQNILKFVGDFQRFLLSQYKWTIRADADEFLIHSDGPQALLAALDSIKYGPIVRPGQAFDVVDAHRDSHDLDLSKPVCGQGVVLYDAPGYAKPSISFIPTTWYPGFHEVYEEDFVMTDHKLTLLHLRYCDLKLAALREGMVWVGNKIATSDSYKRDHSTNSPEGIARQIAKDFAGPGVPVPDWMMESV